jgi:GTP-binding protein
VVDATKGIGHQDRRLIDIALEKGKSVIILLNKMDLMKEKFKTHRDRKEWLLDLREKIPWLYYCDLIPISAKRHKGMQQLREALVRTILVRHKRIPTAELNRTITEIVEQNPIVLKGSKGRHFRVKYASLVKSAPPTFLLFTNKSQGIPENYKRYLQNAIRYAFRLDNSPVHIIFRTGYDLEQRAKKRKKNSTK